eukprot:6185519-Pleurochrysis_carterae.AAC.3
MSSSESIKARKYATHDTCGYKDGPAACMNEWRRLNACAAAEQCFMVARFCSLKIFESWPMCDVASTTAPAGCSGTGAQNGPGVSAKLG